MTKTNKRYRSHVRVSSDERVSKKIKRKIYRWQSIKKVYTLYSWTKISISFFKNALCLLFSIYTSRLRDMSCSRKTAFTSSQAKKSYLQTPRSEPAFLECRSETTDKKNMYGSWSKPLFCFTYEQCFGFGSRINPDSIVSGSGYLDLEGWRLFLEPERLRRQITIFNPEKNVQ